MSINAKWNYTQSFNSFVSRAHTSSRGEQAFKKTNVAKSPEPQLATTAALAANTLMLPPPVPKAAAKPQLLPSSTEALPTPTLVQSVQNVAASVIQPVTTASPASTSASQVPPVPLLPQLSFFKASQNNGMIIQG